MSQDYEDEWDDEREYERRAAPKSSGKAVASLVLGLLSFVCNIFTGLPAILFGILGLIDISRSKGRLTGQGLAIGGIITGILGTMVVLPLILIGLLVPAVQKVREAAERIQKQVQSQSNLVQVGLAFHGYADANARLPLAYTSDATAKPLLSWRVHLLPFLGEEALYKQFKLDEPWDSPTNKALLSRMPDVYKSANENAAEVQKGLTRFRVFVGPGTALDKAGDSPPKGPPRGARYPDDFPDGTFDTLLVAEAVEAVEWTKPEGLPLDAPSLKALLFAPNSKQFACVRADATPAIVHDSIDEKTLRNFITRNDGQPVNLP